jgi:hypothetical protein
MPSGEENEAAFMTRVLAPLRSFARESGWSIIVLHHNSRSRNEYAGNSAVVANTDGHWNISRDQTSTTAELYIQTRDGTQPPIFITEDATGLATMSEQEAQEKAKKAAEIVAETELAEVMAIFPVQADKALTGQDPSLRNAGKPAYRQRRFPPYLSASAGRPSSFYSQPPEDAYRRQGL